MFTILFAQGYYPMMNGHDSNWGFIMMMFWLLFFAVVAVVTLWVFKGRETSTKQDPVDIAKERYAKGEITKEQFEKLRKNLLSK